MQIKQNVLLEGARQAMGTAVIIDVFRAFSVACYVFANGAERIYPVGTVEEALKMKKTNPDFVLIGERFEKKCEGFDFGNSPSHIQNVDFTGKTIVHTTSSGTQGIVLAKNAQEILTGAFVNAKAIIRYLKMNNPKTVSFVAMGYAGERNTQEDDFCSDYLANELNNKENDFNSMRELIRIGDGARLLDPKNEMHSPSSDFDLCMNLSVFDFVLRIQKDENQRIYLKKIDL